MGSIFFGLLLNLESSDFRLSNNQLNANVMMITNSDDSQEWFQLLHGSGGTAGYDIAIDNYGNCYSCGILSISDFAVSDAFLVKYDAKGTQLWNRTWGGSGSTIGNSVAIDQFTNRCYIVGNTGGDGFIVKYDLEGTQLWNRTWGSSGRDAGFGVAVDNYSNIYVAGTTDSADILSGDAILIKFDKNGNQMWNRTWGGPAGDKGKGVAIDSKNYCYLVGFTNSFGAGSEDFFIVKYNSTGTQLWNRTWGGLSDEVCNGIAIDNMDNCYLVGDNRNAILLKLDSEGNQLWYRTWYGSEGADGWDIALDKEFNCYIGGSVGVYDNFGKQHSAAFILKYSSSGVELGLRVVYTDDIYLGYGIAVDNHDNYYISGKILSAFVPSNDGAFILRSNSLDPAHISGFEWLFILIVGQLVSLMLIELKYLKKSNKISTKEN